MLKKSKSLRILKDKSGGSIMLVLGIMLLFMAIGVSALVAASANTGIMLNQRTHNQLMLLDDSIQRNILYSLQNESSSLSSQLVKALCDADDPADLDGMTLDVEVSGLSWTEHNMTDPVIRLNFPAQDRKIIPEEAIDGIDATPEITDGAGNVIVPSDPGVPSVPKTVTVDMTMIVTVEIEVGEKAMNSIAVYEYRGGMLTDESGALDFTDDGYGVWELIRHEKWSF